MSWRARYAAWLQQTHGGLFELTRHFLAESLTSELISSSDYLRAAIVTVLGAIAASGLLILRVYSKKYYFLSKQPAAALYQAAVRADRLFFISLSMLIAGFATVLVWQSLFPSRSDYLVLRPLPLKMRDVFLARFISVFAVIAVVVMDANLLLTVGFPSLSKGSWEPAPGGEYLIAHGIATMGAGLFVFFALLGVQGLLMNLLPARLFERVSLALQIALLVALIMVAPFVFGIPNSLREVANHAWWMSLLPPMWFFGIYESLLRTPDTYFTWLAKIGESVSAGALLVAMAMYLLSYRRYAARVLEADAPQRKRRPRWRRMWEWIARDAAEEAVLGFTSLTLKRSRHHKLLLFLYCGVGLALALDPTLGLLAARRGGGRWTAMEEQAVLAIPLIMVMLMVSGLCKAFQVPAEPRANWIFRLAETGRRRHLLAAVDKFVLPVAIVPALLLGIPTAGVMLGWRMAAWHVVFTTLFAMLYAEMRLTGWCTVPFTCSYLPGRKPLFNTIGMFWLTYTLVTLMATGIEWAVLRSNVAAAIMTGILIALYVHVKRGRREAWDDVPLLFDDRPEPVVRTLDLVR